MLAVCFVILLLNCKIYGFVNVSSIYHNLYLEPDVNPDGSIQCVISIIKTYLSEHKELTFANMNSDGHDMLLKNIHSSMITSLVYRSTEKSRVPHQSYLIFSNDVTKFRKHFPRLLKERTWNPRARFLIVLPYLTTMELNVVFDRLLKYHVVNVVIANGTDEPSLYTYNPFDNFACGKRYDKIISYGKCLSVSQDLYPNKYVTGLRNCTFVASLAHWPPFAIFPTNVEDGSSVVGAEQTFLQLIGDIEGFKVNFSYTNTGEEFPNVNEEMEAFGWLRRLQTGETDAVLGGMVLVPSRAATFSYIYGHLAYEDEIRFMVKKATVVPSWKNVYLEFQGNVWIVLIVTLFLYSALILSLLRIQDKSIIVLRLLDSLLLHSFRIRQRATVNFLLISWVLFAYLVNSFYQSSLVSLTTNPAKERQIADEHDLVSNNLKPCVSIVMRKYYRDTMEIDHSLDESGECNDTRSSLISVAKRKDLYTIVLYGIYSYDVVDYCDEYGDRFLYSFKGAPYAMVIYGIYLYKGFPMEKKLNLDAVKLREHGYAKKIMKDLFYKRYIKYRYHAKTFSSIMPIPWLAYIGLCGVAAITFVLEVLSKY